MLHSGLHTSHNSSSASPIAHNSKNKGTYQFQDSRAFSAIQLQQKKNVTNSMQVVQLAIGDGGKALIGRMIRARDKTIAKITDTKHATYMFGGNSSKAPLLYDVQFYNGKSGFVRDTDPNYKLVPKTEESKWMKYKDNTGYMIPLRSSVLQTEESGNYILKNNKVYDEGMHPFNGVRPFTISPTGRLKIGGGILSGHTGMTRGNAVRMAGELDFKSGVAYYRSRRTGHYGTTEAEQLSGLEFMQTNFPWIKDLNPKGYKKKSLFELFQDDEQEFVDFSIKSNRKQKKKSLITPTITNKKIRKWRPSKPAPLPPGHGRDPIFGQPTNMAPYLYSDHGL